MGRFVLGPVTAFPPGSRTRVEVEGRAIALFHENGFFALRDQCPHMGGPLSAGTVWGAVSADGPGCYDYRPERKFVRCPWHGWEYDVATGQSWYKPDTDRVKAYQVSVETGGAILESEPGELVPGPYVAESYKVMVENEYVVVEV
jgi:3-phenylpropionate/trans-cinnamate dioxygenase ferredoxin subunit